MAGVILALHVVGWGSLALVVAPGHYAVSHTVVFALCLLLAIGVRALAGPVADENSALRSTTGFIGILVSGVFLVLIGVMNLVVLRHIVTMFRRMRKGHFDEAELERRLDERGLLNRLLRGVTESVRKPAHMYPLGLLFGLGFDTATEVSLLVLAGGAAAANLPWYAILTLPVLFTAGVFLLAWLIAVATWRLGRVGRRRVPEAANTTTIVQRNT